MSKIYHHTITAKNVNDVLEFSTTTIASNFPKKGPWKRLVANFKNNNLTVETANEEFTFKTVEDAVNKYNELP